MPDRRLKEVVAAHLGQPDQRDHLALLRVGPPVPRVRLAPPVRPAPQVVQPLLPRGLPEQPAVPWLPRVRRRAVRARPVPRVRPPVPQPPLVLSAAALRVQPVSRGLPVPRVRRLAIRAQPDQPDLRRRPPGCQRHRRRQ